jgi:diguanylate cyclase (GGDEF)-like protein
VHSIRDETGNVLYYEGTVKDISQRKQSGLVLQARMQLAERAITYSLDDILQATLDEAEKLTGSLIGFYHFMESDQTTLALQNWSKRTLLEFCKADGKGMHYPIDQAGVWADCARMAQPIIYNNYHALPNQKGLPKGHAVVDRILTLPIMRGNSIVAIIGVGNKPHDYNHQDQEAVAMLADLAWDIAERKLAEDELKKANELLKAQILEIQTLHETLKEQAVRDALTGLFNRRYLTETVERELARAKRDGSPVCALMMDIDHFKEFNDSYGHNFGDEILVRLSTVLKNNTRTGDIACRFGGDEFIIILPGADIKEAAQRAETIKENFSHSTIQLGGMAVSPMISIGISAFPRHGKNGDELISAADGALYHAKNAGRNRIEIWEE